MATNRQGVDRIALPDDGSASVVSHGVGREGNDPSKLFGRHLGDPAFTGTDDLLG
jgi:hypothetical protein